MDGSTAGRHRGQRRPTEGEETRQPISVADENEAVLLRGVGGRTALRRQSDGVAVPPVRLAAAAARRRRIHRFPDPEPHQLLPVAPGQRQPEDSARRRDPISDRDHLQREPSLVFSGSIFR